MPTLTSLNTSASSAEVLAVLDTDGACIIRGLLPESATEAVLSQVSPFVEMTRYGGDEFSGRHTRRTGALVARSPACRDVVMNREVLDIATGFLSPYTDKILLHLTQTIFIGPGQGVQEFHRDRQAWGKHLPVSIEPQFNTIWAMSDFTADNGATRVVPGSHRWEKGRKPAPAEVAQAEMPRGSVLLYTGSVIHSGGENRTDEVRMGLNITYCLGWLRQEENQYLSCPPAVARTLSPELQALLGYTMGTYALGYYSDPEPAPGKSAGILPPEAAVGSRPRDQPAITN